MASKDIGSMVGPFGFLFHQVAMYTSRPLDAVAAYSALGYKQWVHDQAVLRGHRFYNGDWRPAVFNAVMHFNYSIMPMELEFLTYFGHGHRHEERAALDRVPFISHMSVHVNSVRDLIVKMGRERGMYPYHLFVTEGHTNPGVKGKKRFVECIYDTRGMIGYDIKAIQRVTWDTSMNSEYLVDIVEEVRSEG